MTTPGTILLGYDGSTDSQRALDWAASTARSRNAALRVVVAASSLNRREDVEGIRTDAESRLSAVKGVSSAVDIVDSAASHALLDAARGADLVVLGARGHGVMSGVLVGSVSQHVSRHAPCAVAVIRQAYDAEARAVVVGVDGSKDGKKALEYAFELAHLESRPLVAMHSWRPVSPPASPAPALSGYYGLPTDLESSAAADRVLRQSLKQWTGEYPQVSVTSLTVPQLAADTLADASRRAAIVVVGSRGRGAFAALLLGSVGQAVLERAECPVVIAR